VVGLGAGAGRAASSRGRGSTGGWVALGVVSVALWCGGGDEQARNSGGEECTDSVGSSDSATNDVVASDIRALARFIGAVTSVVPGHHCTSGDALASNHKRLANHGEHALTLGRGWVVAACGRTTSGRMCVLVGVIMRSGGSRWGSAK